MASNSQRVRVTIVGEDDDEVQEVYYAVDAEGVLHVDADEEDGMHATTAAASAARNPHFEAFLALPYNPNEETEDEDKDEDKDDDNDEDNDEVGLHLAAATAAAASSNGMEDEPEEPAGRSSSSMLQYNAEVAAGAEGEEDWSDGSAAAAGHPLRGGGFSLPSTPQRPFRTAVPNSETPWGRHLRQQNVRPESGAQLFGGGSGALALFLDEQEGSAAAGGGGGAGL